MMNNRENPLFNLSFNIVFPIIVLNKGHSILGEHSGVIVLLIALCFPVIYGLFDLIKNKRKNIISIFGVLNVLFTGGFAILKLDGIWFAIKEAAFPLLIGIFVLISAYTKKSFFEYMVRYFPLQWSNIEKEVKQLSSPKTLKSLFKTSTILFSISFFISAALNFALAFYIFTESGPNNISPSEQEIILNKKIADMTWLGFLVIGLPMTVFSIGIFWWFLKKLEKITQLPLDAILMTPNNRQNPQI